MRSKFKQAALIISWALYDLANQFFVLNIVSLYFVRWVTLEMKLPELYYSIAFGVSTFFMAISVPILGAISDLTNKRMPFLVFLTILCVIFTALLGFSKNVFVALLFFIIANFGCQAAVVFYNALLADIAPKGKAGFVSGLGSMFSYSGAIISIYLLKPTVIKSGYQAAFLPTGALFFLFALPCLILIRDKNREGGAAEKLSSYFKKENIIRNFNAVRVSFLEMFKSAEINAYLKMAFFLLCVINVVIIFMSVYAVAVFQLTEGELVKLISFSTFFAIVASIASGIISDRIGAKRVLIATLILWEISLFLGALAYTKVLYWIVGSCVGLALGSSWPVLRAMAIQMAPAQKAGEIFAIYNLVGYLSAICGTLFWGLALLAFSSLTIAGYRLAIFSLTLFLAFSFVFLLRLPRKPKSTTLSATA